MQSQFATGWLELNENQQIRVMQSQIVTAYYKMSSQFVTT